MSRHIVFCFFSIIMSSIASIEGHETIEHSSSPPLIENDESDWERRLGKIHSNYFEPVPSVIAPLEALTLAPIGSSSYALRLERGYDHLTILEEGFYLITYDLFLSVEQSPAFVVSVNENTVLPGTFTHFAEHTFSQPTIRERGLVAAPLLAGDKIRIANHATTPCELSSEASQQGLNTIVIRKVCH